MIWLLAACGAPISNAPFYADEAFLAALPDDDLLAMPAAILDATTGDEPLLVEAVAVAADLDPQLAPLTAITAAIARSEPSERNGTFRVWDAVPIPEHGAWARAEIIRSSQDLPLDWTIEVSPTRIGPFAIVAAGTHSAGGGAFTWDARDMSEILGIAHAIPTDVTYGRADEPRDVAITGPEQSWALIASDTLSWTGPFAVTDDGETWPGAARVTQGTNGGHAAGHVVRDEQILAFERCWDSSGNALFRGGDPGVTPLGAAAACVAP